jgi:hypothetical protein
MIKKIKNLFCKNKSSNSKFIKNFFYDDDEKYNEKPDYKRLLFSPELIYVQPLGAPTGMLFYIDYVYTPVVETPTLEYQILSNTTITTRNIEGFYNPTITLNSPPHWINTINNRI